MHPIDFNSNTIFRPKSKSTVGFWIHVVTTLGIGLGNLSAVSTSLLNLAISNFDSASAASALGVEHLLIYLTKALEPSATAT